MKLEPGKFCPLIGKDCIELECAWFTQIRGTNPQTGKEIDEWGCSVAWMPMLLVENAQQSRQTGAAVESFRNETVKSNRQSQQLFVQALQKQTINILEKGTEDASQTYTI